MNIIINAITVSVPKTIIIVASAIIFKELTLKAIKVAVSKVDDDDNKTVSEIEQRAQTLGGIAQSSAKFAIYGIAFIMILSEWGINVAPILTGAGVIGLAVGFGAQTLVKDVVTGFFILLENQFNVGDKVQIADVEGNVSKMKLRVTVVDGSDGHTYTIPNSKIDTVKLLKKATKKKIAKPVKKKATNKKAS